MSPRDRPFEIAHVPDPLRANFTGRLPEATSGTQVERERNFLSHALATYAIHILAGASLDDASKSIVDGGGDGGMDAAYHSPESNTLWLVQSKYMDDGRGEPSLGDVAKFKTGLDNLLSGRFEAFEANDAWRSRMPHIKKLLNDGGLMVRAVLVYTGLDTISDDRIHLIEDLKLRHAQRPDDFDFLSCNLTTVHGWLRTIAYWTAGRRSGLIFFEKGGNP